MNRIPIIPEDFSVSIGGGRLADGFTEGPREVVDAGEAEPVRNLGDAQIGVDQEITGGAHFGADVRLARAASGMFVKQLAEMGLTESVLPCELLEAEFFVTTPLNSLHGIFHGECLTGGKGRVGVTVDQVADELADLSGET